ncbi:MAG: Mov34/MPN/PAD-1 family protein [Thermaceae bacterium]
MLYVKRRILEETRAHLLRESPKEGVGLWGGRREVEMLIPLPNVHERPLWAYRADPLAVLRALKALEAQGLGLLAIYHSHPQGPAFPSETDRKEAYWRVPYVIFGMDAFRAFLLPEGQEVEVVVV